LRGSLIALCLALLLLGAGPTAASAHTSPTDPQQQKAVIDQIRAQLGSHLADALAAQQQLRQSLDNNASQQRVLQGQIVDVEQKIADLDLQIAAAMQSEAMLAERVDAERAQLRQLARAIYVAPTSILVVIGEAHSLSDLLTRIADLNVAGSRASEIKASLGNDLIELQNARIEEQVVALEPLAHDDGETLAGGADDLALAHALLHRLLPA